MISPPISGNIIYFSTFRELAIFLNLIPASKKFILCDTHTANFCYNAELEGSLIIIEESEGSKSLSGVLKIANHLLSEGADRQALLINLGGGMVTDLGGFVASIFKRGIRFVNVPTTTLAMADAAFGGKTGVNLDLAKNALGTIYLPEYICVLPDFLKTLGSREYLAGFAEIIKSILLFDPVFWNEFQKNPLIANYETILPWIKKSLAYKANVVQQDLNEKGLRKTLNYGHTVGHAIESAYNNAGLKLLHGEAVYWGMQIENQISFQCGLMKLDVLEKLNNTLKTIFPLPKILLHKNEILKSMENDKKNLNQDIRMTLIAEPGVFHIDVPVSKEIIHNVLH